MFDDKFGFVDSDGRGVGVGLWPDGTEITLENTYYDILVAEDGRKYPRIRRKGYKEDCVTPVDSTDV